MKIPMTSVTKTESKLQTIMGLSFKRLPSKCKQRPSGVIYRGYAGRIRKLARTAKFLITLANHGEKENRKIDTNHIYLLLL